MIHFHSVKHLIIAASTLSAVLLSACSSPQASQTTPGAMVVAAHNNSNHNSNNNSNHNYSPAPTDLASLQDTQNDFEQLLKELQNDDGIANAQASQRVKLASNHEVKSRILQQYSHWKGVRYRLGGDTRRGVDCSAFVQRTFLDQFGIDLPRSTAEQRGVGKRISRDKLRSGDLVLFKAGSTGQHVGIYIGNNQFIHASERKGVIISSLDNPYWKPRYREARRILTSDI